MTTAAAPLAILSLNCGRATLRATVRDPTLRLRVQIDGLSAPGARCLIDGRQVGDMPRDVAESLTLVRDLARSTGIEIGAVAHRVPHGGDHVAPELIDDTLLAKLVALSAAQLPPDLVAIEIARTVWPDVPHVACFETAFDIDGRADAEAVLDRHARAQLQHSDRKLAVDDGDHRADRMLADPRGYFARARRRARAEITRDIAQRSRR